MSAFERHRQKILPAIVLLVFASALLVFHKPIISWFSTGRASGMAAATAHQHTASSASRQPPRVDDVSLPRHMSSEPALAALRVALEAYEEIRARLASDAMEGVSERSKRAAEALHSAAAASADAPKIAAVLGRAAEAAHALAAQGELAGARVKFGELSRELLLMVGADDRLAEGRHVFQCPMTKGYDKWIQTSDKLENPYMGPKMLTCGSESELPRDAGGQARAAPSAAAEVAYYTCPMHTSVKQSAPGKCPICGMELVPVTKTEVETGVIVVDSARRQLIGVKTASVERRSVKKAIRTVGKITYDERRLVDVSVKFKGWIGQLFADETGQRVKKGSALFTVYSPEVYGALQELLIVQKSTAFEATGARSGPMLDAAKQRLSLWDVPSGVVSTALAKREVPRYVPIVAPASGFIVEKNVVEGSTVEPGARLFRIANLDKVWIEAELYEAELPLVAVGHPALVTLAYLPDKRIDGKVTYVYPYLSGKTRTGRVRIELDNRKVELKPDMYANVELEVDRGERLLVPESAVVYAGPRRLVFVDLGEGKLRPQEVQVGLQIADAYEVLSGLHEGDKVVTSGNFLIAAESRLKSATQQW